MVISRTSLIFLDLFARPMQKKYEKGENIVTVVKLINLEIRKLQELTVFLVFSF